MSIMKEEAPGRVEVAQFRSPLAARVQPISLLNQVLTPVRRNPTTGAFSRARAADLALLMGVVLLALFLRVYALNMVAWVPDSYDRLGDAGRLASGRLPQSTIYPP